MEPADRTGRAGRGQNPAAVHPDRSQAGRDLQHALGGYRRQLVDAQRGGDEDRRDPRLLALGILGTQGETGFVFTLASDPDRALPENRLSRFVRKQHQYFGLEKWQPHDLRRTFTTLAKGFGYSDLIINKAQARKDRSGIRTHYDKRRYYDELRQLYEAVEREILRIIGQAGEPAKVIQLR